MISISISSFSTLTDFFLCHSTFFEVIDFDPPSSVKTKRPRVTFNEELNSVVPVIALPEKGHLKPVCPMESEGSGDLRVRRGLPKRKDVGGMDPGRKLKIDVNSEWFFGF